MVNCACGFPRTTRTSWTHDNPGRKFKACKFYNHETGHRGCNTFDWVDVEEPTNWQRDVINMLVAEKHRVATDNHILKSRLVCVEHQKNRLEQELENINRKPLKRKEIVNKSLGFNAVCFCVIVSVVISVIVVKVMN
ncbi:uncharacterized protein LOC125492758 [Beta vulgaris subsp. vulgaris]|uniref:uncharacterized protein LOC125492758 n=1 Tax=Beta vulgaris subsp. vulgaris TaxID=3555 RepID=UPI0020372ACE|nr:uncharacterized protein LOC125492758 [Beta vulgaris subsp. vulgaris]